MNCVALCDFGADIVWCQGAYAMCTDTSCSTECRSQKGGESKSISVGGDRQET